MSAGRRDPGTAARRGVVAAGLAAALVLGAAAAGAQDLAVVGGRVVPVAGPAIDDGAVLVRDGRIAAVGPTGEIEVPAGVEEIDAGGLVVTPGFIDARSSVALDGGARVDGDALVRPTDVRMAEALEELRVPGAFGREARETPAHPWVMDGVTTAYAAPGDGNLVAGFGAVVKLAGDRLGPVVDSAAAMHVVLGDGPVRRFDAPTTRQGMAAVLRQWLDRARAAGSGARFTLGPPGEEVEGLRHPAWTRTPDLDAVLDARRPVRFRAHTPDDVLTAVRVAGEFDLAPVVEGATGAHLVAQRLAEQDVPVVLAPAIVGSGGGGSPETFARTPEAPARLHRAGVRWAFSTGGSGGRPVTVEAIVARGHGLPADAALRALTLDAARILGVERRTGSIEVGKDADLVLWSGDPVGTWGEVRATVVDGEVVFRRAERR